MQITIGVELTDNQVEYWIGYAILHKHVDDKPVNTWSREEVRRVVHFAIVKYLMNKGK